MNHLPHLDGLRALAVSIVIIFHLGFDSFSGGFVGVDIFFVLSGFFISRLIMVELETKDSFNVKRFYVRRLHRLLPALLFTVYISFLFAVFILQPAQLKEFGLEMSSSIISISNILFWNSSGYFDANSEMRPLLHTWSLSVEEQFYLFWPAVLYIAYRLKPNPKSPVFLYVILLAFTSSFLANIFFINLEAVWFKNQLEGIFFLTPFRIYEFAIGAFAVLVLRKTELGRRSQDLLSVTGLSLVAYSTFFFNSDTLFPYLAALAPCFGTLMLIVSPRAVISKRVLGSRPFVFIGLISYSLYLVHWPVIVLFKHWKLSEISYSDSAALTILIVVLALISYKFVEQPYRLQKEESSAASPPARKKYFVRATVSLIGVLLSIATLVYYTSGFEKIKNPQLTQVIINDGKSLRYKLAKLGCSISNLESHKCNMHGPTQILVLGNSHEVDAFNVFTQINKSTKNTQTNNLISFGNTNKCNIKIADNDQIQTAVKARNCAKRVNKLNQEKFIDNLDFLVFSAYRPFAENKKWLWEIIFAIKRRNPDIKLIVLGGYFSTQNDCSQLINRFGNSQICTTEPYVRYNHVLEQSDRSRFLIGAMEDYFYIDKFELLCEFTDKCEHEGYGEPMAYDTNHLSLGFARKIGDRILEKYKTDLIALGFLPVKE